MGRTISHRGRLSRAIRNFVRKRMRRIYTGAPGVIVAYDRATNLATVQLATKEQRVEERGGPIVHFDPGPLTNVVVCHPATTSKSIIYVEPTIGDTGRIVFSHRSLDAWKLLGKRGRTGLEAVDVRMHDVSDGFFILDTRAPCDPMPEEQRPANCLLLHHETELRLDAEADDNAAKATPTEDRLTKLEDRQSVLLEWYNDVLTAKAATAPAVPFPIASTPQTDPGGDPVASSKVTLK